MSCEAENSESMENKEKQGFLKKISSPKKKNRHRSQRKLMQ